MKLNAGPILLMLFGSISITAADTILLKNGNTLDGIILNETPTEITLDVGVGSVTVKRSQIATIQKAGTQDESRLQDDWQRRYFSHEKYVPPGLENVASEFRALESQRNAAMTSLAHLHASTSNDKVMEDELLQLKKESADCMRQLPPEIFSSNTEHKVGIDNYNKLIVRHNALQARMEVVNHELAQARLANDRSRKQISSYLQALYGFQGVFAARLDQYRKAGGTKQEDVFFTEMKKHLESYSSEIRETDVPFEVDGRHMIVSARINNRVTARLLVDTGASLVQISESLARKLGLAVSNMPRGTVTLADGRKISVKLVMLDSVQVAGAQADRMAAVISASAPSPGVDGLLGMNFLQEFDVRLDGSNNKLIFKRFDPQQ